MGGHEREGFGQECGGPPSATCIATALEDGAVQIEAEAFWRHWPRECEKPFPKWPPERFDVALAKAKEEIAHGVGAGKPFDAEQCVKAFVGASQSVWARRRAPATTEMMKATRGWAGGMALGLE